MLWLFAFRWPMYFVISNCLQAAEKLQIISHSTRWQLFISFYWVYVYVIAGIGLKDTGEVKHKIKHYGYLQGSVWLC